MNAKILIPWLCAGGLAVAAGVLYMNNQQQATELTQRRAESQELKDLKESAEAGKKNQTESENAELAQLRDDNKGLLKLRADYQKLKGENDTLKKQLQTSQNQLQSAQTQAQNAQAQAQSAQTQAQAAQAQAAALRLSAAPATCINNLRMIDNAKNQWATENGRPPGSVPGPADLAKYLPNQQVPSCPGGGAYSINPVGVTPTCTVPGHVLQK